MKSIPDKLNENFKISILGFALVSFNQTLGCLGKTPTSGV